MYAAEWWTVPKLPWRGGRRGPRGAGFEAGGCKEGGVLIALGWGGGKGRHSGGRGRGRGEEGEWRQYGEPTEDDYSKVIGSATSGHGRSAMSARVTGAGGSVNLIPS